MELHPGGPPFPNSWPQSNHEENTRQMPPEGPSTHIWLVLLKTIKVIQNVGTLRNHQGQEKSRRRRDSQIECSGVGEILGETEQMGLELRKSKYNV